MDKLNIPEGTEYTFMPYGGKEATELIEKLNQINPPFTLVLSHGGERVWLSKYKNSLDYEKVVINPNAK